MRPLAIDLFCGAGGASMGLHRAGFDVIGVDIKPQPRYPFTFVQGDAINPPIDLVRADFIWASPPCQAYSVTSALWRDRQHPDLVGRTRQLLNAAGPHYAIENVVGAPLRDPFMLCGKMFGLKVYRHRLFETSFFVMQPGHPQHRETTNSSRRYSTFATGAGMICVAGHNFKREDGEEAMGIDWMSSRAQLSQAIPPTYSEFIGRAALACGSRRDGAAA